MKRTHPRWTLLLLALLLLFPMGCRKEEEEKPPLTQEEKETRQARVTEAMAQVDLDQDLVRLEPYADDGKGLHLNSRETVSYTHLRAHETRINIAYAVFCL